MIEEVHSTNDHMVFYPPCPLLLVPGQQVTGQAAKGHRSGRQDDITQSGAVGECEVGRGDPGERDGDFSDCDCGLLILSHAGFNVDCNVLADLVRHCSLSPVTPR